MYVHPTVRGKCRLGPQTIDLKMIVLVSGVRKLRKSFRPKFAKKKKKREKVRNKKREKLLLYEWARCPEAIGVSVSQRGEELRLYKTMFRIRQYQNPAQKRFISTVCRPNGSFFRGDGRGFLKDGVRTYLMASISPISKLPNVFSRVYIYSLWLGSMKWSHETKYLSCWSWGSTWSPALWFVIL